MDMGSNGEMEEEAIWREVVRCEVERSEVGRGQVTG